VTLLFLGRDSLSEKGSRSAEIPLSGRERNPAIFAPKRLQRKLEVLVPGFDASASESEEMGRAVRGRIQALCDLEICL
jgi:hypothetical protein